MSCITLNNTCTCTYTGVHVHVHVLGYIGVHEHVHILGYWGTCTYTGVLGYMFSNSYNKSSIIARHRRNEKEKRRQYEERICNIEHGSFTPLVFTTAGGMGPSASTFYKYLSSRLSIRYSKSYSKILNWIRCRLSFSLLRSSIMCLRGARSSYHHPCHSFRFHEQALSDGRVY